MLTGAIDIKQNNTVVLVIMMIITRRNHILNCAQFKKTDTLLHSKRHSKTRQVASTGEVLNT